VTSVTLEQRNGRYIVLCIWGTARYCIFSTGNTVIGLCLATKSVHLWRNICRRIQICHLNFLGSKRSCHSNQM